MKIFNSLTRKKEEFKPIKSDKVGMYACGMTVYDYAHIGHGRKYVNDDILRRTLTMHGYQINHIQNVTDVGHLVSDSDEGEDKLEKGARKTGKTVWEVAEFYTKHFYDSMDKLNIIRPTKIVKATEHISGQIDLVKKLVDKGYAYDTSEAVYFDITKFSGYGKLFGQKLDEKRIAVREEVEKGSNKKHPQDFALWFKRIGRFKDHAMHWDSPWGDGFPGWHIECSAMSMKYLGEQFDIHTGGEDHKPIHHPNEIAQSEAATGKHPFVKYWVHTAFLTVNREKMSKSLDNFFTLEDVVNKGYDPLSLRYLYLTTHYRKQLNFTWEALGGAQNALNKLRQSVLEHKSELASKGTEFSSEEQVKIDEYRNEFKNYLSDDLNTSKALAVAWEVVKSNIPVSGKLELLLAFDEVLGLNLKNVEARKLSPEIESLLRMREDLRKKGKYGEADVIRDRLKKEFGIEVKDSSANENIK